MATRRQIIAGLGGALVAGAAAGTWRVTRQPETARRPWFGLDGPVADVRLDAFRHAILAPNPHNRQPWLIKLEGGDQAVLSCDLDKRLPATDPFDRQIVIGFGTFIELTRIAAAQRGHELVVAPFPEGEPQSRLDGRPLARLQFVPQPGLVADPLFAAIPLRRSNKQAYDLTRQPAPAMLAQVADGDAQWSADADMIRALREQVLAAVDIELHDHAANMESVDLMRIGATEVDAQPDGIALSGPMIEALHLVGIANRESLADPGSSAFASGTAMLRETYGSIPALLWVMTPGNSRTEQLDAGRRYVRANLRAAVAGLAVHPMSQSLQEYPAVAGPFTVVHRLLGASGTGRVQMLARIGYGPATEPAPRWPLETHIRT